MNFFTLQNKSTNFFGVNMNKNKQLTPKQEAEKLEKMTSEERHMYNFKQNLRSNREASKVHAIDNKLKSGQKVTKEEMEELKAKNPELYEDAKKVQAETNAYEKSIKNAKTKEDVEKIKTNSMCKFSTEIKEVMNNTVIPKGKKLELVLQIGRRFNGVVEVHNDFVKSGEFSNLPSDRQELKDVIDSQKDNLDIDMNMNIDENSVEVSDDKIYNKDDTKKPKEKSKSKEKSQIKTAQKMNLDNMSVNDFKGAFLNVKA